MDCPIMITLNMQKEHEENLNIKSAEYSHDLLSNPNLITPVNDATIINHCIEFL